METEWYFLPCCYHDLSHGNHHLPLRITMNAITTTSRNDEIPHCCRSLLLELSLT